MGKKGGHLAILSYCILFSGCHMTTELKNVFTSISLALEFLQCVFNTSVVEVDVTELFPAEVSC